MELFKFKPVGGGPVILEQGESVNYVEDLMWIERYRVPGEFKIKSLLSSGLKDQLPLGTLVSHIDTSEVMMVENIKIVDHIGADTKIEITGRSLDAYLEQRVIGWNLYWQYAGATLTEPVPYIIPSGQSYLQATHLIKEAINTVRNPPAANDSLTNISEAYRITLPGANYPVYAQRNMKRQYVSKGLLSILEIDDLGIRVVRTGFSIQNVPPSSTLTKLMVHDGINKSGTIIFSWDLGDLDGADYLFSIKKKKTDALVVGRYLDQVVTGTATGLNKTELLSDGDDIDGIYQAYPSGANKATALAAMTVRGNEDLAANRELEITSVNISKTNRYRYRRDYDIGDLVMVDANYGAVRIARVVEHVEVEDKNGEFSYPTLSIVDVA